MELMAHRARASSFRLVDFAPAAEPFLEAVLQGLAHRPRRLPPKYLYDARGASLFEAICEQPEYYLTRAEISILRRNVKDIARRIGPRAHLIEYGSGGTRKARMILDALESPVAYTPIDISVEQLRDTGRELAQDRPSLEVIAVAADFTRPLSAPPPSARAASRAAMFMGSNIGNFDPADAVRFLSLVKGCVGAGGALLLGVDLEKDARVLEAAYDDSMGVTAAFNLNILDRMRRELGARIEVIGFDHRATWNGIEHRVEMHLEARRPQAIEVQGHRFVFERGETIHTESSYKYTLGRAADLARHAGFDVEHAWTDDDSLFALMMLRATDRVGS